jgi:poly-gamma-glutamate biosynthesis protein PgsC/CapC
MHDYLFTTEVVRFAFMFGVAVSMLLYERRHLTTGSIVVPGYIAMFLAMPLTIVATFANAILSYLIVNRFLRRWFLLYGRTKFTVLAVISIFIQTLMLKFSPTGAWLWERDIKLLVGVGYVVPALIAHDMARQGFKKTIKSVMLAGFIVATPIAIALALHMPGINDLAPLRGGGRVAIEAGWIPISVMLSAAAGWGVARNWGLRSGGFMGAAFVAILLGDPWQIVVLAVLALMTYVIVTRLLMNSMILFGRRKFSSMLLVSASLSWALLWIGGEIFGLGVSQHIDIGSLALTPLMVPGLLANDAQRTTPWRVLGGLTLATGFVISMTWSLQAQIEHRGLDAGWRWLALATTVAIFGKPVYERLARRFRVPMAARTKVDVVQAGDHSFGLAGYRNWAAMHREAAEAAERWLATMLGERPSLAIAGLDTPLPTRRPNDDTRSSNTHAGTDALEASAEGDETATPSTLDDRHASVRNREARVVDRLRLAALKALGASHGDDRSSRAESSAATIAASAALPVRNRSNSTIRGEFDVASHDIVAAVDRPDALPRRQRPSVAAHPDQPGLERRTPRPSVFDQDLTISQSPHVATRAHHATSGSEGIHPTEHEPESKSGAFDVFPG